MAEHLNYQGQYIDDASKKNFSIHKILWAALCSETPSWVVPLNISDNAVVEIAVGYQTLPN